MTNDFDKPECENENISIKYDSIHVMSFSCLFFVTVNLANSRLGISVLPNDKLKKK